MTSIGAMSLNDEDSFEILSQEPSITSFTPVSDENLKSIVESLKKEVEHNDQIAQTTPVTAPISLTFDATHEELQELIKENEKLKNTLQQTNLSMKTNLEKILLWKCEVNKVFEINKKKLEEFKDALNKANESNVKLSVDVEKYKHIKDIQDEELLHLKSQIVNLTDETKKQSMFCVIDDNGSVFSSKKVNVELEQEINDIKKEKENLVEKLANVEETKDKIIAELKEQVKSLETIQNTNFIDKDTEIDKLRKEICHLQEQIVNNQKEYENTLLKQKEMIGTECENLKTTCYALSGKNEENKRELNLKDVKILKLQQEIEKLLIEKKDLEKQINIDVTPLKTEIQELKTENIELNEKIQLINQQLINAQKTITKLNEDLTETKRLQSSQDEYFALTQQLEVYKNDFEAERQAREALNSEKTQLADDLINIQRRNQQLQAEIDALREGNRQGYVVIPKTQQSAAPQSTNQQTTESSPKLTRYSCPMCNSQFRSLRLIQEHVEGCTGTPFTD